MYISSHLHPSLQLWVAPPYGSKVRAKCKPCEVQPDMMRLTRPPKKVVYSFTIPPHIL